MKGGFINVIKIKQIGFKEIKRSV